MKNSNLLNADPILISWKEGELMPTANLGGTPFIDEYRGCGDGIAYVKEKDGMLYLLDFNYGGAIKHDNLDYTRVNFSATQILFLSDIEKSKDKQNELKNQIDVFAKTLDTVKISGKEFLSCKTVPSFLDEYKKESSFGFLQLGSFKRKHNGEVYGPYKNLLPQEGAYEVYCYDRNIVSFTWSLPGENMNTINLPIVRFYDSKDNCYEVLVNPNVEKIEADLNDCFENLAFKALSENVKSRFIYQHKALTND